MEKHHIIYDDSKSENEIIKVIPIRDAVFFITNGGKIYSQGKDNRGILGTGDVKEQKPPVLIKGINGRIKTFICNDFYSVCAITEEGEIYAWGNIKFNNLKTDDEENYYYPHLIKGIPEKVKDVAIIDSVFYALTEEGNLYILTNGIPSPVKINKIDDEIVSFFIKNENNVSVILTKSGKIYEFNVSSVKSNFEPEFLCQIDAPIKDFIGTVSTVSDDYLDIDDPLNTTFFIITEDGEIFSWGGNNSGQAGLEDRSCDIPFTEIKGINGSIRSVKLETNDQSFALTENGELYAWGKDWGSRLGLGMKKIYYYPEKVKGINGKIKDFSILNSFYTFALTEDGRLYAWGTMYCYPPPKYPLPNYPLPTEITGIGKVKDIHILKNSCYIINENKEIYEISESISKNNKKDFFYKPVKFEGIPEKVTRIISDSDENVFFAFTENNNIYAWGDNSYGRLGTGKNYIINTPALLTGIKGKVKEIRCDNFCTYALTEEGELYVWGWGGKNWDESKKAKIISKPLLLTGCDGKITSISLNLDDPILILTEKGSLYSWCIKDYFDSKTPIKCETINGKANKIISQSYHYPILITTENNNLYTIGRYDYQLRRKIIPVYSGNLNSPIKKYLYNIILTEEGKLYEVEQSYIVQINDIPEPVKDFAHIPDTPYNFYVFYVLTTSGKLYASGDNRWETLGIGNIGNHDKPERVNINLKYPRKPIKIDKPLYKIENFGDTIICASQRDFNKEDDSPAKIITVRDRTYLLTENGLLFSCGNNDYGKLGVGIKDKYCETFSQVRGFDGGIKKFIYSERFSGFYSVFALTEKGSLYSWGYNKNISCSGNEENIYSPNLVKGIKGAVTDIFIFYNDCDKYTRIYLHTDEGIIYAMPGIDSNKTCMPLEVQRFSKKIKQIILKDDKFFVLTEEGVLYSWEKQTPKHSKPSPITSIKERIREIIINDYSIFALTGKGTVYALDLSEIFSMPKLLNFDEN